MPVLVHSFTWSFVRCDTLNSSASTCCDRCGKVRGDTRRLGTRAHWVPVVDTQEPAGSPAPARASVPGGILPGAGSGRSSPSKSMYHQRTTPATVDTALAYHGHTSRGLHPTTLTATPQQVQRGPGIPEAYQWYGGGLASGQ